MVLGKLACKQVKLDPYHSQKSTQNGPDMWKMNHKPATPRGKLG